LIASTPRVSSSKKLCKREERKSQKEKDIVSMG